jgi:hypothetical protein
MARTYTQDEIKAVEKAERDYAPLGLRFGDDADGNTNMLLQYFEQWNPTFPINAATIKQAIDLLTEKNLLKWISPAQLSFEAASRGLSVAQLAVLTSGLSAYTLITEGDEGYENKVAMLGYLQGRSIDHDTIFKGASFLQAKGVKLYWKPAPSQNQPSRGHNASKAPTPQDMVWISKEDANRAHVGKINHSSDPRFNGEKERQEKLAQERRFGGGDDSIRKDIEIAEKMWQSEIDQLRGETHAETERIQAVARQTPGGAMQRHKAAVKEQAKIQREKQLLR